MDGLSGADLVRWVHKRVKLPFRGEFTSEDGRVHWTDGWFDKDEQDYVVSVDRWLDDAEAAALLDAGAEDQLAEARRIVARAEALDAWFRGDTQAAWSWAERARALQDAQRSVAWRFAEVVEALALVGLGRKDEARARLDAVDALTLWHAVAELFCHRADLPHMRALYAVSRCFRVELGRSYPDREAEGRVALERAGVPEAEWVPTSFPR